MNSASVELAQAIATKAHAGQFRRGGVIPYIAHPLAVTELLRGQGESAEVLMTALLHDVLEDTAETRESLLTAGIPEAVVAAVELLTKADGADYEAYLARVKTNELARKVKIADMRHNLSDSPTEKQIQKYAHGLLVLVDPPA